MSELPPTIRNPFEAAAKTETYTVAAERIKKSANARRWKSEAERAVDVLEYKYPAECAQIALALVPPDIETAKRMMEECEKTGRYGNAAKIALALAPYDQQAAKRIMEEYEKKGWYDEVAKIALALVPPDIEKAKRMMKECEKKGWYDEVAKIALALVPPDIEKAKRIMEECEKKEWYGEVAQIAASLYSSKTAKEQYAIAASLPSMEEKDESSRLSLQDTFLVAIEKKDAKTIMDIGSLANKETLKHFLSLPQINDKVKALLYKGHRNPEENAKRLFPEKMKGENAERSEAKESQETKEHRMLFLSLMREYMEEDHKKDKSTVK
ncbi:MAG: hypothetical protein AABZ14_03870, partial [Candidatus Margulisiibacteriota bacterium]